MQPFILKRFFTTSSPFSPYIVSPSTLHPPSHPRTHPTSVRPLPPLSNPRSKLVVRGGLLRAAQGAADVSGGLRQFPHRLRAPSLDAGSLTRAGSGERGARAVSAVLRWRRQTTTTLRPICLSRGGEGLVVWGSILASFLGGGDKLLGETAQTQFGWMSVMSILAHVESPKVRQVLTRVFTAARGPRFWPLVASRAPAVAWTAGCPPLRFRPPRSETWQRVKSWEFAQGVMGLSKHRKQAFGTSTVPPKHNLLVDFHRHQTLCRKWSVNPLTVPSETIFLMDTLVDSMFMGS